MLNIKSGSILTNGLGGPAYNLLMFGPVNLYIEPYEDPTPPEPTPEPTPEPQEYMGHAGGLHHEEEELKQYKVTFVVKVTKRKRVERSFIVDKNQKEIIIRRIGKINTSILKFKAVFRKIKKVFTFKWKK